MNDEEIIEKVMEETEDWYWEQPCKNDVEEIVSKALALKTADIKEKIKKCRLPIDRNKMMTGLMYHCNFDKVLEEIGK